MRTDLMEKINKAFTIKNVSYVSIILNLASIIFGIFYLAIPIYTFIWDIFGVIILLALFGNVLLIWLNSIKLNKSTKLGNRINILCYIYLLFIILAMIGIAFNNFMISITYSNALIDNLSSYFRMYLYYFGLLVFGICLAVIDLKNLNNRTIWGLNQKTGWSDSERVLKIKKTFKFLLKISSYFTFVIGILCAYSIVGPSIEPFMFVLAVVTGQFGILFSLALLANTIILLKIKNKSKNPKRWRIHGYVGVIVSTICMMPLVLTPSTFYFAGVNFTEAFGEDWKNIPPEVEKYFLDTPFSTPEYFLGIPPKDCIVKEHILFFNDTTGAYKNIRLYFDAYLPPNNGIGLPGQNSTIIRLHGGGWVFGDKQFSLGPQLDKYLAAQGYIVFDIQYAIRQFGLLAWEPITQSYKKGMFTMDEIIATIGIFCKYISNHSAEYGANLNSTFVSGGSAGGQLTMATALGIHSGKYASIFGTNITIKGLIPYYPANGMPKFLDLTGDEDLVSPERLIDSTSPPCLVFAPTHDLLTTMFRVPNVIKDAYTSYGNKNCALLWMLMGGHAGDIYFNGYYSQVFLYFMERFLYLYH
jgi:predicted esterase